MTTETAIKNLKPSQIETLKFAASHPHITMPQLAEHASIRSTSARSRIGHLFRAGLLKSKSLQAKGEPAKRGDAKIGFMITPAGKAAIKKAEKAAEKKAAKSSKS
jgi:DNA-binding MarR family transcriptional regulator